METLTISECLIPLPLLASLASLFSFVSSDREALQQELTRALLSILALAPSLPWLVAAPSPSLASEALDHDSPSILYLRSHGIRP